MNRPLTSQKLKVLVCLDICKFLRLSHCLLIVPGLEFAYSQAPSSLEGVVMGLNLVTTGLGSYLATAVVNIVNAATSPSEYTSFYPDLKMFVLNSAMID